jgi:carbonic anhydrase
MCISADDALARLTAGNGTYVRELTGSRVNTRAERLALGDAQRPWATILTCADSRMAPEILFNQGLGDLFVARVAGNVAGPFEIATLEFGAAVVETQLIVVLGHAQCAAVVNALAYADGKAMPTEALTALVEAIAPAVEQAKAMGGDRVINAVKTNALMTVARLRANALLAELGAKGRLKIVAAYCDLASGAVSWL